MVPLKCAVSSRPSKRNLHELPKSLLRFLSSPECDFATTTSFVSTAKTSSDGSTTKLLVTLQDGHVVESVLMRHTSPEGSRATLCVSSQVGCAMGCTFCATGTMGFRGNLCEGEILEQLVHAGRVLASELNSLPPPSSSEARDPMVEAPNAGAGAEDRPRYEGMAKGDNAGARKKNRDRRRPNHELVRNVVFMGMGEPLNNYSSVVSACRALIDRRRWNLAHTRVTVSTVGVIPKMRRLTSDLPEVGLALSLHAPNQEMRTNIVPTAKVYPIEDLIGALDEHMMAVIGKKRGKDRGGDGAGGGEIAEYTTEQRLAAGKQKRAMIEYVMLEGPTSTLESAHQLGKLCENRHLYVNLIPYNQTDVRDKLRCPSAERMEEFKDIVASYGCFCFVRRTMGADIDGACGQLAVVQEKGQTTSEGGERGGEGSEEEGKGVAAGLADIEEGPFFSDPSKGEKRAASTEKATARATGRRTAQRGGGQIAAVPTSRG